MGKNKSKHRVQAEYSARRSILQKVDNELKKQGTHKPKASGKKVSE